MNNTRPIEILLVEDNPGEVRLMQEVFKECKTPNNLNVVEDGVEAMEYLRKEGKYADSQRPDIILLDLNLPRKDGREVLAEIKADDNLKRIPVVVLTVSEADEDVLKTYESYGNCYITKPAELDKFIEVVRTIEQFWLKTVKLPPR